MLFYIVKHHANGPFSKQTPTNKLSKINLGPTWKICWAPPKSHFQFFKISTSNTFKVYIWGLRFLGLMLLPLWFLGFMLLPWGFLRFMLLLWWFLGFMLLPLGFLGFMRLPLGFLGFMILPLGCLGIMLLRAVLNCKTPCKWTIFKTNPYKQIK